MGRAATVVGGTGAVLLVVAALELTQAATAVPRDVPAAPSVARTVTPEAPDLPNGTGAATGPAVRGRPGPERPAP
jgi:hypothetical protein